MALPTTPYNFTETEQKLLAEWLSKGIYKPEYSPAQDKVVSTEEMKKDSRQPWALICPPPNAYARPHMGNISGYAYMDVMARFQRMQGKKVLVLPGKDHAGLEGEGVFVREVLEKQGRRKFDMKREDFYAEMMDFFEANMAIALKDEKEIGLSADFDRDTFTLDPQIVETVLETFVEMYKKKMIYKGVRIVNWDPKARTAVADNQIEYEDRKTPFFYFKYPLINQDRRVWRLNFYKQEILDAILAGTKTIETRVLNPDEKDRYFAEIKAGDIIVCVNKNTGENFDYEVTDARVYTDLDKFIKNEDFTKINSSGKPAPESVEKLIESYNTLAPNYGEKMKENGIIAVEIKKFEGDPDPEAVRLKNKFMDPKTTVLIQQINALTMEFDETIPFITGKTVEVNREEVLIIGYNKETLKDLNYEDRAQPIGIFMRLDKKPQVIFAHKDLTPAEIDKVIERVFMYSINKIPGVHIIKFADYPEDKFYTNGFILGTVRPETKFGDTALAVALKDKRYAEFIGKAVNVQTLNGVAKLNIVEDYAVEKEFGTGMVKVTPAHSAVDWEIAQRHPEQCLPAKQVIGYDLRLNHLTGPYNGLKIGEAREVIMQDLKKRGTLVHLDENYTNRIQIAERTKAAIEPLLSSQWYLKYDGIKEAAAQMIADGTVTIHPDAMVAKFNHWMENLRDWAISRSLWWGYRMPVWYHGEVKEEILQDGNVGELIQLSVGSYQSSDTELTAHSSQPEAWVPLEYDNPNHLRVQKESPGEGWFQDENVLDTWFSSGQWPYATLMRHGLMDTFFPTNVLVSAHDILENWDSRMMMFSHFKTGKEPFKDLFLTGLVKGTDGQKMSKSRGNILSTDAVREQYGTDSLRMAYYYQNSAGASYAVTFDKLKNFKNFNNKLWNASKFVLMNSLEQQAMSNDATSQLTAHSSQLLECKAVLEHIADVKQKVTKNITDFEFGYATETLYEEFWHSFCDVHIEQVKKYFYTQKNKETGEVIFEPTAEQKKEAGRVMLYALREYLKMLHPFIPFITQRIWDEIPKAEGDHKYLMYTAW